MDKAALFRSRLPEADVEVSGVGVVRVRGLSRAEVLRVQQIDEPLVAERRILAFGMVDPALTEDEVSQWQEAATAGELEPVSLRIAELSGITEGSAKEAYKSVRGEPDA